LHCKKTSASNDYIDQNSGLRGIYMPDWEEIVRRDGPAVWRTAYRLLNNPADADECFQEAFVAALEVSRREQVENWRALLLRLAAARAVDRLRERCRRRSREQTADWNNLAGDEPPPSQGAEEAELAQRLRDALAQIPAQQAEVFSLHGLEGWSYQEIAEQLSLSINAVGVLLHRARKRLRELLAPDHEQTNHRKDPS
jgi:RNA polymerase sigma-70 factor (ECF subfamily)